MSGLKKILYFDCSAGISGDMTLGALLDLGLNQEMFLDELDKLHLQEYEIKIDKVQRNAITATKVHVHLSENCNEAEYHCHKGHTHTHEEHTHEEHTHEHHVHDHDTHEHHTHEHHDGGGHFHRSFRDIRAMIEKSDLSEEVKDLSLRIFLRVAKAEAKVHGKDVEEVQFHEVGAVDSIIDIVGSSILFYMINPDYVCASVVQDGHGFIHCQHGMLSVPVPAVSEIFADSDVITRQIDVETELVTPTGAAIIAELASSFGQMPEMNVKNIGWGAGTKILKIPNLLKVSIGYGKSEAPFLQDEIVVLQTNLDDCSGEMLGNAMEILFCNGALDVYYTSIYMKKNRPAWCLTVLAKVDDCEKMEWLIFKHTTTIGIRKTIESRSILNREIEMIDTPYGSMKVKKVKIGTDVRIYPEYESAAELAKENGKTLWEILESYGK